jgi:hypothetical protein
MSSVAEIMQAVKDGTLSAEEAAVQVEALSKPKKGEITLKVSEVKKCVQIGGIRWRGITLYRGEIETILANKEKILAFIEAHKHELATK